MYKYKGLVKNSIRGGNMKKIILVITTIFIMTGCGNMMNTPTKKVETFLSKYQTLDKKVIDQLDEVIEDSDNLNDQQREKYHELMKKQYQNLSYKVKEETLDGDNAVVTIELEVLDYGKAIKESETYLANNRDEFVTDTVEDVIDKSKFLDYKIDAMSKIKDKVTYTINFNLTKDKDNDWKITDISDIDRLKLHGLYY